INLIVFVNSINAIARQEKIIKKPLGLKPSKTQKTIIDEFRHLSPDDVEFLKQVDKQFKMHGNKIKIKVERENATVFTNKNTKRTIDDSLGYGYNQNQQQRSYYFSQPHLMHRFTEHDVPADKGGYREKAIDIEVQQSHSFEIKDPEMTNYQPQASAYHHEQVYEDPVPVIVLRVPGPSKYALHLQALLQQYLEIRAAQFIKALEDQERHGQLLHPQHYLAQQNHQMHYIPMVAFQQMYQQQPYYQQQDYQQQYYQQPQVHQETSSYQIPAGEQSYYKHQPSQQESIHSQSHQEYPTSYINFVTPAYEQGELHHKTQHIQHHHHHDEDVSLETVENYPSEKHTQVIFKKKKNRNHRPSVTLLKSEPIVVPDQPSSQYEEVYENHQSEQIYQNHQTEHDSYGYASVHSEHPAEEHVVAVTQRSKGPINYHVLQSTLAPNHKELQDRHIPKRMAPFTKEYFEKAHRIMTGKSRRNRMSLKQEKSMMEKSSEEKTK
ncbi:CLUMA_CG010594, isoform A, partial [Clunio marinus]